jgi:UDP-N-acetylmuramate dehydrogenase
MPLADVALAPYSSMEVGGPARWFVDAPDETTVAKALEWADQRGAAVHVLGGGSNVVIADEGFEGLVIRIDIRGLETSRSGEHVHYRVAAGEPWDPLVALTVADNCAGLECLSGIPGFAGGTPIQNVGAYGQDVSGSIVRVRVIERRTRRCLEWSNAECGFAYRSSRLKRDDANRFIVTHVEFALAPDGRATVEYADVVKYFHERAIDRPLLGDVREAVLEIRRRKGMVLDGGPTSVRSCGSFFVNPVVPSTTFALVAERSTSEPVPHFRVDGDRIKIPAAWLIERSGFTRGWSRGAVGISPFQSQAIVNLGGARAADVLALACDVKQAVLDTFNVALVPEPVFVGFHESPELRFLGSAVPESRRSLNSSTKNPGT